MPQNVVLFSLFLWTFDRPISYTIQYIDVQLYGILRYPFYIFSRSTALVTRNAVAARRTAELCQYTA